MRCRSVVTAGTLIALAGCLVLAAGPALGGPISPKFVGDSGDRHGESKAAGLGIAAVSANSDANLNLAGAVLRKGFVTLFEDNVVSTKAGKKNYLSPQEFLDYLKSVPDRAKQAFRGPPKNNVLVVDTQKWLSLTPAQRDALTIWRNVTKTRTYLVTEPVFQARMTVCYPCCCHRMVNYQTGTQVVPQVETVNTREPAGANYQTKVIAADRDLYFKSGHPYYRTALPQYIDGSDGKPYPLVPIKTDATDNLVASGGGTTTVNEGLGSSKKTVPETNVQIGWYHGLVLTGNSSGSETVQYVSTSQTSQALKVPEPLGDPAVAMTPGPLNEPGRDAGLNPFTSPGAPDVTDVVGGMSVSGQGQSSVVHRVKK